MTSNNIICVRRIYTYIGVLTQKMIYFSIHLEGGPLIFFFKLSEHNITALLMIELPKNRIIAGNIKYKKSEIHPLILIWDDDISGAYRLPEYNTTIAGAFTYALLNNFFLPTGGTFGYSTSPQDYDPFAQARDFVA